MVVFNLVKVVVISFEIATFFYGKMPVRQNFLNNVFTQFLASVDCADWHINRLAVVIPYECLIQQVDRV